MKKLLIPLFSLLISFNSIAGGIEKKGLVCEPTVNANVESFYFWFQNGKVKPIEIEGYGINWDNPEDSYIEDGTNIIKLRHSYMSKNWRLRINRQSLIMSNNHNSLEWQCAVVSSKEEMTYLLNLVIDAAKKINKI
jgi:hypothetical protein